MKLRIQASIACALLFLLPGCKGGCGKGSAADGGPAAKTATPGKPTPPAPKTWEPLLRLIPDDVLLLAFVPEVTKSLADMKSALGKLRGTTLGMTLEEIVRATMHKAGMPGADAFDPATWASRGFDLTKGAALAQTDEERGYLLFGVSDVAKVEPFLQAFLKKSDDVATFKKLPSGITLTLKANGLPAGGYVFKDGLFILAGGPFASEDAASAYLGRIGQPTQKRFVDSPSYARLVPALGLDKGVHLVVFPRAVATVPAESRAYLKGFEGVHVALTADASSLRADAFLPTSPETSASLKALAAPGAPQPGLARFLGDDTLLAAGGRVALGELFNRVLALAPFARKLVDGALTRLRTKLDIDVEKELFANLAGDGAFALHKLGADVFPLALGGAIRELIAADPLHLTLLLRVKDAVVASKFLRKIAALADAGHEKVGAVEVFPIPLLRISGAEGGGGPVMRFALSGDVLVLTLGKGRMEKALAAMAAKDAPFAAKVQDAEMRRRLIDQPGAPVAYVLGESLLANLKDLEGALLQKGNLMLSNVVQKIIEVAERFADLALGGEAAPGGVKGFLRVRFK